MNCLASYLLAGCCMAAPQEVQSKAISDLVERLGSHLIEERDEAVYKLRELGRIGLSLLKELARSSDSEVSLRAQEILREIAMPEPGDGDLTLKILKDGSCIANGKVFADLRKAADDTRELRKLEDLFECRRQDRQSGGVEYQPEHVDYTLFVENDAKTPCSLTNLIWKLAAEAGGVRKIVLKIPDLQKFVRLTVSPRRALHEKNTEVPRPFVHAAKQTVSMGTEKIRETSRAKGATNTVIVEVDGTLQVGHATQFLAALRLRGITQIEIAAPTR